MRIIILGAGQVGGTLASNLAFDNDVTIIDTSEERLNDLQHRLDIKTVAGNASHPNILIEAGIKEADMLIAVTNSDEINMLGCQIAYSLFNTPMKIARIRSLSYHQYPELFQAGLAVDVCISPEELVTKHLVQLINYPGASEILEFADGKVLLVTIKPKPDCPLVGKTLNHLEELLQAIEASVVAIFRGNEALLLSEDSIIEIGDEILFVASKQALQQLLIALGRYTHPNRRVMIAGGGHIGTKLAQTLEKDYRIKIIERNYNRAHEIAGLLNKSTVLQGDIADRDLLVNENIEFTDVFCAVTNDDETNIMSCLQAKNLGTRHVITLVNRHAYVDIIDENIIDHAISPQRIMIGSILTKLRRGNMVKVYRFQDEAEAIELVIRGSEATSRVIGRSIEQLELPPTCIITAIIRKDKVFIANKSFVLLEQDHILLLIMKKKYIPQLETLFQVNLTSENLEHPHAD